MKPFNWAGWTVLVLTFSVGFLGGALTYSDPPCPETTSVTGTPGGGEILMRAGETPEPWCFLVGQVTTSGHSQDAAGRGRMFFARKRAVEEATTQRRASK